MRSTYVSLFLGFLWLCVVAPFAARADVLLDETDLIAQPSVAAPQEHDFAVPNGQALSVTLTDFQTPAAFATLQIAVTLGDALVGSATVDATSHTATVTLAAVASPASTSQYALRVIGTPDATQGFGAFGVCVSLQGDPTNTCISGDSFAGTIVTPQTASTNGSSALQTNFTTTAVAGNYTVTLTDDAFPAATQQLAAGISLGSSPVNTNPITSGTTTVSLAANTTYQLLVAAVADATTNAGLYGIRITDPSGSLVFNRTIPIGMLGAATVVANPSAQSLNLSLADEAYPSALARLGAVVTSGSAALATLTAPGSATGVTAPAGSLELWTYASAGAQPGVYDLTLGPASGASLYAATRVVNPSGTPSNGAFAFVVSGLASGGSYNLALTDLKFPSALTSMAATVAQGGVAIQTDASGNFTAASNGSAVVFVNAQAPQTGSGIFDVAVTDKTGSAPVTLLDQTQAVGATFTTRTIPIGTNGTYNVTLSDLKFPAAFANLAIAVSQGAQVQGEIYGAGAFPVSLTPGSYLVTIVDVPGSANYGLFSLNVSSAAPTVTFTANSNSVTAGQPVQLNWSTQNATACTASGTTGWSGNEQTSGTAGVTITASATLTLTCTGPGGSTTQSLSITATPAPAGAGSGGGGAFGLSGLAALAALVALRAARARARPTR